jgi:hypothetical protein
MLHVAVLPIRCALGVTVEYLDRELRLRASEMLIVAEADWLLTADFRVLCA